MRHIALTSMNHADDCLICSRERKAAMRSFGADCGSRSLCSAIGPRRGFAMMSNFGGDVGSAPQYSCQETRTDENKESPPIGFALEADNPGDVGLFPGKLHRETSMRTISSGRSASRAKEATPIRLLTARTGTTAARLSASSSMRLWPSSSRATRPTR